MTHLAFSLFICSIICSFVGLHLVTRGDVDGAFKTLRWAMGWCSGGIVVTAVVVVAAFS